MSRSILLLYDSAAHLFTYCEQICGSLMRRIKERCLHWLMFDKPCDSLHGKIKPLETIQRHLIWLHIHPADESASSMQKWTHAIFAGFVLASITSYCVACLAFCVKFHSVDLVRCVLPFMSTVGLASSTYMLIAAYSMMRPKIAEMFGDLSVIHLTNETLPFYRYLVQANDFCEWMTRIYTRYSIGLMVGSVMTSVFSVIYCWLANGHPNVDNFFHPFPVVLPWNQETLLGYFGEIFFSFLAGSCYLFVTGTFLMTFISICIHHRAFSKMFEQKIDVVKGAEENECDEKFLCDLIRFHISVKDFFVDSAKIFSPFVTVQLIYSTLMMAVPLFYLGVVFKSSRQFHHHMDFNVYTAIGSLSIGMMNAFLYCYFGTMTTESFAKMRDCLFEMNWYELPIKQQKYFILMAANMQRPCRYLGFGVLVVNLETFVQILRAVFSYYGIIKTITSK